MVDFRLQQFRFAFWREAIPTCCDVEDGMIYYNGEIVLLDENFREELTVGHFEFRELGAPLDPAGENELLDATGEDVEHSIVLREILEHVPSMDDFRDGVGDGWCAVCHLGRS